MITANEKVSSHTDDEGRVASPASSASIPSITVYGVNGENREDDNVFQGKYSPANIISCSKIQYKYFYIYRYIYIYIILNKIK